jgi:hypothetical protein
MEPKDVTIRWKVVSSRAWYWGKKIMKPGQIFSAPESAIPIEFRLTVIPLDVTLNMPEKEESQSIPPPEVDLSMDKPVIYRMNEREDKHMEMDAEGKIISHGFYYDVISSEGKVINEQPLTKEQAKTMIKKLK